MKINDNLLESKRSASLRATGVKRRIVQNEHSYLVTIKPHAIAYHSKDDLDGHLARVVKRLTGCKAEWSSIVGYEEDSAGRMHLHTIVLTSKIPLFSRVNNDKKVQVHFQHLESPRDKVRGQAYVAKLGLNKYAVEQRFDANYIRHSGGFYFDIDESTSGESKVGGSKTPGGVAEVGSPHLLDVIN